MIDKRKNYISQSSVYRILKSRGLVALSAFDTMAALQEYRNKTQRAKCQGSCRTTALLHQWRTEGVHNGQGDGAHPGKTEPSIDAGQDRALPQFDEEHHQTSRGCLRKD